MQKLVAHRLYTEDVNRKQILDIVSKYVDSYTVFPSMGVWNTVQENSICIEMTGASFQDVAVVAQAIKDANNQEAVLYTAHELKTRLF